MFEGEATRGRSRIWIRPRWNLALNSYWIMEDAVLQLCCVVCGFYSIACHSWYCDHALSRLLRVTLSTVVMIEWYEPISVDWVSKKTNVAAIVHWRSQFLRHIEVPKIYALEIMLTILPPENVSARHSPLEWRPIPPFSWVLLDRSNEPGTVPQK